MATAQLSELDVHQVLALLSTWKLGSVMEDTCVHAPAKPNPNHTHNPDPNPTHGPNPNRNHNPNPDHLV